MALINLLFAFIFNEFCISDIIKVLGIIFRSDRLKKIIIQQLFLQNIVSFLSNSFFHTLYIKGTLPLAIFPSNLYLNSLSVLHKINRYQILAIELANKFKDMPMESNKGSNGIYKVKKRVRKKRR